MANTFNLTAEINLRGPTDLKATVSKIKKELGSIKTDLNIDIKAASAKNIATITRNMKELSAATKTANTDVNSLAKSLASLSSSFGNINSSASSSVNGINNVNKSLSGSKKALSDATTQIEEFGKQSGLAIRRFAAFSTVTSIVYSFVNALNSAFKEFVNFDKEFTRLAQVTDSSASGLKDLRGEITRLSTDLGVASSDLVTASVTLAQAGLSATDTKVALEALAKSALAPSFDSLTETTEGSIAVLRQFGLETKDLEKALGSINAVAAAFAVEASDLVTAIQRTGGVFASSSRGVSEGTDALNEFLAIFTSVRATTRESAETIATGLRTIFTRIQRGDTIDALKEYGVVLTDLENKFVGPFEAVRRLSEGLNQLDPRDIRFSRIVEELGGFRQIGKVIPLIQQFAVAQEALKVAQTGQDSLAKDAVTAQQSLANQFAKTRESFVALVRDIGDGATFRSLTTVTLGLANGLIATAKALEPLIPLLTTLAAIKLGSSLTQFASGFGRGFGGRGGGGAGVPSIGPSPTGGTGGAALNTSDAIINNNTAALNALLQVINTANQNINVLNTTVTQNNTLLSRRSAGTPGFARGGFVPGSGNRDTVPARLTPGEFVIRKKAVKAIGADRLHRLNRYGGGGRVKFNDDLYDLVAPAEFAQGGIVNQRVIAAAILKEANSTRDTLTGSKKSILKSPAGAYLTEQQKSVLSDYDLVREGISPDLRKQFMRGLRRGLITGVESAVASISNNLGVDATKIQRSKTSINNFMSSINDASMGNLFEDVLSTVEKAGSFSAVENPRRPFDFTDGLNSAISQRLFPNISSSGIKYVDAKASLDAARPGAMLSKIIDQIILDHPGGPITGTTVSAALPSSAKDAVLQRLEAAPSIAFSTTDLQNDKNTRQFRAQINKQLLEDMFREGLIGKQSNRYIFKRAGFAKGGSVISPEDTVPAMLTPGEFVINKQAAQKIGYRNLHKLNRTDRVRGYNKGGIVGGVQTFANGGEVLSGTNLIAIVSIFTNILQPQIEKLAGSFSKTSNEVAGFGTALSGALKESTSLLASAGFGLAAVGADRRTTGTAMGSAGTLGLVGGGISAVASKNLEVALNKNSAALSQYQQSLQAFEQATTDESRVAASRKLEESFAKLSKTFAENSSTIDQSQRFKDLGEAITSTAGITLAFQTSILALNGAVNNATNAMNAAAATSLATSLTGKNAAGTWRDVAGNIMTGPNPLEKLIGGAAGAPGAVGVFGKLASAGGSLLGLVTKFLGPIGLLISGIQIAVSVYQFFNKQTAQAGEEALKLADAMRKTAAAIADNTLVSDRFSDVVLAKYNELKALRLPETQRLRTIGTVSTPGGAGRPPQFNDLNTLFRAQAKAALANINLTLGSNQSINELLNTLSGSPEAFKLAIDTLKSASDEFTRQQFIAAKKIEGIDAGKAQAEFVRLSKTTSGLAEIQRIASEQAGRSVETDTLARQQAIQSANALSKNFVRLSDITAFVVSRLSLLSSSLENQSKNLDTRLSIISGQPKIDLTAQARTNATIFENIRAASTSQLEEALRSTLSVLTPAQPSAETSNILKELADSARAIQQLEQNIPTILTRIAEQPIAGSADLTDQFLTPLTEAFKQADIDPTRQIDLIQSIREAVTQQTKEGKAPRTLEDLFRIAPELADALGGQKNAVDLLNNVNQTLIKNLSAVSERANQLASIFDKINDLEVSRLTALGESEIDLNRLLGQRIKGADLNKLFDQRLKAISGGSSSVEDLGDDFDLLRDKLRALNETNTLGMSGEQLAQLAQEQASVSSELIRTERALQTIVNGATKVKNAFDDLIEKEKRLFQGPEDLILEFIGDPQKLLEAQTVYANELQRLSQGVADAADIRTINRVFGPIANTLGFGDELRKELLKSIGLQAGFGSALEGDIKTSLSGFLLALNQTALGSISKRAQLGPELTEFEKQRKELSSAYDLLINVQKQLGDEISKKGIIVPLNDLTNELQNIIPKRIAVEQAIIDQLDAIRAKRVPLPENVLSDEAARKAFIDVLSQLQKGINGPALDPETRRVAEMTGLTGPVAPKRFALRPGEFAPSPEATINEILTRIKLIRDTEDPNIKSLKEDLIDQFGQDSPMVKEFDKVTAPLETLKTQLELQQKAIEESTTRSQELQKATQDAASQMQQSGQQTSISPFMQNLQSAVSSFLTPTPQSNADPRLDTNTLLSSLSSSFDKFVSSFETSLKTQGEQFGLGIVQNFTSSLAQLSSSIGQFRTASENLVASLEDFNRKGGIKAPNIPQQITVSVNFDDEIVVRSETDNGTLLADIGGLVRDAVTARLKEFTFFGDEIA